MNVTNRLIQVKSNVSYTSVSTMLVEHMCTYITIHYTYYLKVSILGRYIYVMKF